MLLESFDRWQRRHRAPALAMAVAKKFGDDRGSTLASLVAYYCFLSIFPLLLVLVSVLGFVLDNDPSLRDDVIDSAFGRIPVIGTQLRADLHPITGSTVALVVGLVGALWAALGVTVALTRAFDTIWDVPRIDQRSGLRARLVGLVVIALLGAALVASTVLGGLAGGGGSGALVLLLSVAIDVAVLVAVFWLLTDPPRPLVSLLPGAATGAAGLLALQAIGGWYVDRAVTRADDTYGVFAAVIGLLSWFWLVAHVLVLSAELNVVLRRHLWPRALTGDLEPADRVALRRSAEAARRDPRERIDVSFTDGDG